MTNDPVIPDAAHEPEPSPAVVSLRREISYLQNAVFALGNTAVKAKEGLQAHEILSYLDGLAQVKIAELDSVIATEILQRPVKVEGGSKISRVDEASH